VQVFVLLHDLYLLLRNRDSGAADVAREADNVFELLTNGFRCFDLLMSIRTFTVCVVWQVLNFVKISVHVANE